MADVSDEMKEAVDHVIETRGDALKALAAEPVTESTELRERIEDMLEDKKIINGPMLAYDVLVRAIEDLISQEVRAARDDRDGLIAVLETIEEECAPDPAAVLAHDVLSKMQERAR
jgi:hypothetical protein